MLYLDGKHRISGWWNMLAQTVSFFATGGHYLTNEIMVYVRFPQILLFHHYAASLQYRIIVN